MLTFHRGICAKYGKPRERIHTKKGLGTHMNGVKQASYPKTVHKKRSAASRIGRGAAACAVTLLVVLTTGRLPLGGGRAIAADVQTGTTLSMSDALHLDKLNASRLDAMVARVDESYLIEQEQLARYDYAKPVPAAEAVADDYFSDAVFIGNSQMVGFSRLSDFPATYYCSVGLSVVGYFSELLGTNDAGQSVPVPDALRDKTFSKVYLLFGVNELGWGSVDSFISYYERILDSIQEVNPDAKIYVESVLPINEGIWTGYETVNNKNVLIFNEALRRMTEAREVYFLNVHEAFADAQGGLPADKTSDGVHLNAQAIGEWADYLRTHTSEK